MKQEHKDAIHKKAKKIFPSDNDDDTRHSGIYAFGAEFGYHLRDEEVKELEEDADELSKLVASGVKEFLDASEEITRLKGLIEEAWKVTDGNRYTLEEFKQKHNL